MGPASPDHLQPANLPSPSLTPSPPCSTSLARHPSILCSAVQAQRDIFCLAPAHLPSSLLLVPTSPGPGECQNSGNQPRHRPPDMRPRRRPPNWRSPRSPRSSIAAPLATRRSPRLAHLPSSRPLALGGRTSQGLQGGGGGELPCAESDGDVSPLGLPRWSSPGARHCLASQDEARRGPPAARPPPLAPPGGARWGPVGVHHECRLAGEEEARR
jgi:hypothetical protein